MQEAKKQKLIFDIFAIFLICILCFAITPVTLQNDTFYTIKIGELISQNGIDMLDHFSWHSNLPYTYPHWLYDLIVFQIYNNFGFMGIYISTIILSCILGVCLFFTNSQISKNKKVSLIISLFAMYLIKDYIAARAQLVTFILFILEILFIERFIEKNKKRYLIYLLIIPILIANLHVAVWPFYFVILIPYIAEFLIYYILKIDFINWVKLIYRKIQKKLVKAINEEKIQKKIDIIIKNKEQKINKRKEKQERPYKIKIEHKKCIKWIIIIAIIAIFTGFVTPLKIVPYTYLVKTMQGNTTENINEHLPLTLIENKEILIVFSLYLALLIFSETKIKLRDLFMLTGLTFLSFMSRRQASMFILISSPIFTKLIVELIEKYNPKIYKIFNNFLNKYYGKIITIIIILVLGCLNIQSKQNNKFIDETCYPVECAKYIKENFDISGMKIFNDYNYGSYLIFSEIPVFIDSRADLYTPEFNRKKNEEGEYEGRDIFSDFLDISSIATYYEDKFEEYGITHVLTERNSKLNMLLSRDSNYELLYRDDYFIFYKRLTVRILIIMNMKIKKQNIKSILIIVILVVIDQIIKKIILANKQILPIELIHNILILNYEENFGIAFGLAKGGIIIFCIINLIIIGIVLKILFTQNENKNILKRICLTLISAGGIGNLIDRIFRGYVIDYIDFSPIINFPIFNFADIIIVTGTIGFAFFIILELIKEKDKNDIKPY